MTTDDTPTPPVQPVRRLRRSDSNRMLAGVCGGLADYFKVDATLVRLIAVVIGIFTFGTAVVGYLLAYLLMESPEGKPGPLSSYVQGKRNS